MENNNLNNIVNRFIKIAEGLRSKKTIKKEDLKNHSESNLHSWLQYALIKSGELEGLFSIPECKLRFSKPLDPSTHGVTNKKRKRNFSRVDIAFFDESKKLVGVSEIFTMDEAHGALPSRKLRTWLSPRDSLIHLIKYASPKPEFIIIVTILLRNSLCVFWKTKIREIDSQLEKTKDYYNVFKPYWENFKKDIEISNVLLIIHEDGIERY